MGIGALNYQGVKGGLKLNDVIEEFKYVYKGQQIKAGDFVNYINGVGSSISATDVSAYVSYRRADAVQLDENRVAVTYYKDTKMLCCTIIIIQNLQISIGTEYSVSLSYTFTNYPSIALIDTNKLLICFNIYNSGSIPCAVVATVSDTTVSFGSVVQSTSNSGYIFLDLCKIDTDKAVAGFYYSGNDSRCGNWVVTVSGTVPSLSATPDVINYYGTEYMTLSQLDTNMFLMSWYDGDGYDAMVVVCSVSGTSISYHAYYNVGEGTKAIMYNSCVINNSKAVTFQYSVSGLQSYVKIGDISGISITWGSAIAVDWKFGNSIWSAALSNDKIIFAFNDSNNSYSATYVIGTIDGTSITFGTAFVTNYTRRYFRWLGSLINGQLLALYTGSDEVNSYLELLGIEGTTISNTVIQNVYEQQVTLSTEPPFDGIALSSGVGGDKTAHNEQVKIARADYNLIKNGDFSNGLEGWAYSSTYTLATVETIDGYKCLRLEKIADTTSSYLQVTQSHDYYLKGHKIYMSYYGRGETSNTYNCKPQLTFYYGTVSSGAFTDGLIAEWQFMSRVFTAPDEYYTVSNRQIGCAINGSSSPIGTIAYFRNVKVYDLTAIFGKGNEPTQEWCDENL